MSDLTSWTIVRDCDDGSLIVESITGARQHIWQGGDAKLLQEIERLRAQRLSDEDIDRIAVRMAQIVLDTPLMSGSVDDFEKWCRVSQVKGS